MALRRRKMVTAKPLIRASSIRPRADKSVKRELFLTVTVAGFTAVAIILLVVGAVVDVGVAGVDVTGLIRLFVTVVLGVVLVCLEVADVDVFGAVTGVGVGVGAGAGAGAASGEDKAIVVLEMTPFQAFTLGVSVLAMTEPEAVDTIVEPEPPSTLKSTIAKDWLPETVTGLPLPSVAYRLTLTLPPPPLLGAVPVKLPVFWTPIYCSWP